MRGYRPPTGLNTEKGARGWATRQADALAKMSGTAEWRAIDAERQRAYAERERAALAEVDARRSANLRLRVTCPCCDGGSVPVEKAELVLAALDRAPMDENARDRAIRDKDRRLCPVCDHGEVDGEIAVRIVDALSRLPANRDPSHERLQILYAIAKAETYHGTHALRPSNGAHHPRRAAPVSNPVIPVVNETPDAQSDEEAVAALQVDKPARRFIAPPFLE